MDAEEQEWLEAALYNLMCDVVNGDRSDWMIGMGEPSHVDYMIGRERDYPERTGPCCWCGSEVYLPSA